jgi:hypothetical protein
MQFLCSVVIICDVSVWQVIDLVGQLVNALKKVRAEIVHSHDCRRARHRRCANQASGGLHHHYDLLGGPFSPTLVGPRQPTCSVALLFMVLVRILTASGSTISIRPHVLRVMTLCGTCCCFPARSIIGPLTDLFKNGTSGKVRALGCALLERTIYLELGAISNQESAVSCVFCNGHITSKSVLSPLAECSAEELLYETVSYKRSGIGSPNSKSSPVTDLEKIDIGIDSSSKSSWECLELYRELVQSPDYKLSHTIASHLLKIAPRCTPSVKHRLLFKVFYPTFIAAKTCWFQSSSSLDNILNAKFNILSCLSAFSSILSTNVTFAEEFVVQYKGLDHILELISLPSFSKLCCSVLEVTSVVEIWKLQYESGDTEGDMGKLPSLHMLQEAVQSATTRVLSYLGVNTSLKCPEATKTEPSYHEVVENVSNAEETDEQSVTLAVNGQDNKILLDDLTQKIREECDMCNAIDRLNEESYVQLLATLCVFWRTCANLVLYSPQYREHLSKNALAQDGLTLLQILLDIVTSKQQSGNLYFV